MEQERQDFILIHDIPAANVIPALYALYLYFHIVQTLNEAI